MSEETIDYRKLAEALAEALEQRNLWIEGEEYRELVILRMRLSARVDSLAEELKAATARIAELSQAVGLITTLKPTMVMDTDHPLDMAKEVAEYVNTRIAELEAEVTKCHELQDSYCDRIAELEAESERFTVHSDIERQDDKWIPEVQE